MSDQQTNQPKSIIILNFADIGSVELQLQVLNVTPLQMLAAASYLELKGKNALLQQENERAEHEARQQLSVPKPSILIGR